MDKEMGLSVATNWDIELLDGLKELSHVKNVFGKMPLDIIGGGRAHQVLPTVDKEGVKRHVEEAHKRGLTFTYLLNANCLGNIEHKPEEQGKIYNFLGWLSDIEVDAVTLTNPILIRLVKKSFPKLKIGVSVFAQVSSIQMAQAYEDMGCDLITLPYFLNRDFKLLESIRKAVKCELQLFVQNACMHSCTTAIAHGCFMSHASQVAQGNDLVMEYYAANCALIKLRNPEEYIKSRWIRPEDLRIYKSLGYSRFKITDRSRSTSWLLNTAKAYNNGKYEGNLADILSIESPEYKSKHYHPSIFANVRRLFIDQIDRIPSYVRKWVGLQNKGEGRPYIDNQALDGFLEYFKEINCRLISCKDCRYCKTVADKVIRFNEEGKEEYIDMSNDALEDYIKSFELQARRDKVK
ncbi:MAG: U32 family peptidase [Candidatus Helarchaeota archaeon]|nr:U32 family peptidase [Candidatus Helarchaeota archaeon]